MVPLTEPANELAAPEVQYLESAAVYSGDERDVPRFTMRSPL